MVVGAEGHKTTFHNPWKFWGCCLPFPVVPTAAHRCLGRWRSGMPPTCLPPSRDWRRSHHRLLHRRISNSFDANRAGWVALLAHWWERRFDVFNRGFSGYNTRWMLPIAERVFVPEDAAPVGLVVVFLGANDCVLPGFSQHG